jgi:carbonic anhydrase/acetyltransferase-like protein (isoleucine patch superfamily)
MRIEVSGHRPEIDETAWIAPTANVIGRVKLGAQVSIWYNAVLRGDTELITVGERSNIQDGCVLHADPGFPATVGAGVSVGHNAILHGCTVEDDCLIGMGATVLNGAVIGRARSAASSPRSSSAGWSSTPWCICTICPSTDRRRRSDLGRHLDTLLDKRPVGD